MGTPYASQVSTLVIKNLALDFRKEFQIAAVLLYMFFLEMHIVHIFVYTKSASKHA